MGGEVDKLDARVVAADDSSAQITELACKLELMDARLAAFEDQDLNALRSFSALGGEGILDAKGFTRTSSSTPSSWDRSACQSSTPSSKLVESGNQESLRKQPANSVASTASGGQRLPSKQLSSDRPSTSPGREMSNGER